MAVQAKALLAHRGIQAATANQLVLVPVAEVAVQVAVVAQVHTVLAHLELVLAEQVELE